MQDLTVMSVGFSFPGGDVEFVTFEDERSLLDADIIIFEPSLGTPHAFSMYQGKSLIEEHASFRVKAALAHWRRELQDALSAGKVVIVYLARPIDAFVHTGNKSFSGTGKNRQVIDNVAPVNSYEALPFDLSADVRQGKGVAPPQAGSLISSYWAEYGSLSPYEITLRGEFTHKLLQTRTGKKVVGVRMNVEFGTLLLLPPLRYDDDAFTRYDKKENAYWNKKGEKFGEKLLDHIVGLARIALSRPTSTPPPAWSQKSEYAFAKELEIEGILSTEKNKIAAIASHMNELRDQRSQLADFRALLYESGKPLEKAVILALRLFGFSADNFNDGSSEFDIIFSSSEGRCLGEVEGKEKKAVNIAKLSQLERNIQEDYSRDDVEEYAKGVLFGNAFRFVEPRERGVPFTDKCISGAKRSRIALVNIPDMLPLVQYLLETSDPKYAKACRERILSTSGQIVAFPEPPVSKTK